MILDGTPARLPIYTAAKQESQQSINEQRPQRTHAHSRGSLSRLETTPSVVSRQSSRQMALSPYFGNDPFFNQIERAMDRAFDRALGGTRSDVIATFLPSLAGPSSAGGHPMDIVETKDSFQITADAPGFSPADISVEMHDGTLTIAGKRQEEKLDEKDGKVVRRERHFASFSRSFTLPDNVKDDGITASLDKGVLRVAVPKTEPAPKPQPKRIQVTGSQ